MLIIKPNSAFCCIWLIILLVFSISFNCIPIFLFLDTEQHLGQDLQFPELNNGAVGGNVKFTPNNPPSTAINLFTWEFGTTPIMTGKPDSPTVSSTYKDRVFLDKNTLALELWNLTLRDSGPYSLSATTVNEDEIREETSLQVFGECVACVMCHACTCI